MRGRLTATTLLVVIAGLAAWPAAASATVSCPIVMKAGEDLSAQFGYRPAYVRNIPSFDAANVPYLRSRTANEDFTSFVQTLSGAKWARRGFLGVVRALHPDFVATVGGGGMRNGEVVFDRADRAYTLLTIRLRSGALRNLMLWSLDHCSTWHAADLPDGLVVEEHWVGNNEIDGPPFLMIQRQLPYLPNVPTRPYELLVTKPRLEEGTLVVPDPVEVSDRSMRLVVGAGGSSPAVTWQGLTHFVWPEITTDLPGSPTYAATFDPATNTLSPRVLLGTTLPRNDGGHCSPAICVDPWGYLHVVLGAHQKPFAYVRSLMPGDTQSGWTSPVDVLSSGYRTPSSDADGWGEQTYVSLVCGSDGVLHLVSRQSRQHVDRYFRGVIYMGLISQRLVPGGHWSKPRLLLVPPAAHYSIFYQELAIDHAGRLFVSCSCLSGPERQRFLEQLRQWELAGGQGPAPGRLLHRMVLISDDSGLSWRLATGNDLKDGPGLVKGLSAQAPPDPRAPLTAGGVDDSWTWRNPLPQGDWLSAASAVGSDVWAVGARGAVLHSADDGASWSVMHPTAGTLYDVQFVSPSLGWTVGIDGVAMRTTDGGQAWTRQKICSSTLLGLQFLDENSGWAVGVASTIMHTTDGGLSWTGRQHAPYRPLNAVCFSDPLHGWAVGNGALIMCTTDGGVSWSRQNGGAPVDYRGVCFVDSSHGWIAGEEGVMLFTSDGGSTWRLGATPTDENLHAVRMLDQATGWAVGTGGVILSTHDGGLTWTGCDSEAPPASLNDLLFLPSGGCLSVGSDGAIVTGGSGPGPWRGTTSGPRTAIRDATTVRGANLACGDDGLLLRSSDGGASWPMSPCGDSADLTSLASTGGPTVVAAGRDGSIVRSTDAGATWSTVATSTGIRLNDVALSGAEGFAVGERGLLASTDGGATWGGVGPLGGRVLQAVATAGGRRWCAVGGDPDLNDRATAFVTSDGGRSWKAGKVPIRGALTDVTFVGPRHAWATGVDWGDDADVPVGIVAVTTDGGLTWSVRYRSVGQALLHVCFPVPSVGFVVGAGGLMLRTVDGGRVWWTLSPPVVASLHGVAFADALHGWIVGDGGAILSTSDGGRNDVCSPATWASGKVTTRRDRAVRMAVRVLDADSTRVEAGIAVLRDGARVATVWVGKIRAGGLCRPRVRLRLPPGRYAWQVLAEDPGGNRERVMQRAALVVKRPAR